MYKWIGVLVDHIWSWMRMDKGCGCTLGRTQPLNCGCWFACLISAFPPHALTHTAHADLQPFIGSTSQILLFVHQLFVLFHLLSPTWTTLVLFGSFFLDMVSRFGSLRKRPLPRPLHPLRHTHTKHKCDFQRPRQALLSNCAGENLPWYPENPVGYQGNHLVHPMDSPQRSVCCHR